MGSKILASAVILVALACTAVATPLRLDYAVTDLGGSYRYDFTFVNDDNDGTWLPGQSFRWFVFGDSLPGPSPLTGFVGDTASLAGSPYTGFGRTAGGHNGPDLQSVLTNWVPSGIGDSFSFWGTSTAFVPDGALLWSNVTSGTGTPGVLADFEVANRIPEPTSMLLLGLGGLLMAGLVRRRRN